MNDSAVSITPKELKRALQQAFRQQNEERFEEPLINYLGWHIFGVTFPKEDLNDWLDVFNPDEAIDGEK